ncbi:hypothetical protein [Synechococcus sp. PCC 7336]|uniref:hypothetical protein n=1 Tax=Synechococcus sp. PCC 7336 TaxID=195250 RepID=UPI000349314C|nr:hypothetical protein [Synechococcus sp. PCC 7336]
MHVRVHLVVTIREYTLLCFADSRGCHFQVLACSGTLYRDEQTFSSPQAAEWGGREWIRTHSQT